MADEPVTIRNYLDSADTRSTLDALRKLGAGVEEEGGGCMVRARRGPARPARGHRRPARRGQLGHADAAAAGLARGPAGRRLDARRRRVDPAPAGRPGRRAAARRWAPRVEAREGRFPPLHRRAAPSCAGIDYELPVASAQVKSCVLIAGHAGRAAARPSSSARRAATTPSACCAARACRSRATDGGSTVAAGRRARAGRDRRCPATRRRPPSSWPRPRWCRGSRVVIVGRGAQLDPHRLLPHRRAHGRRDPGRPRGAGQREPTASRSASSTWPPRRSRAPRWRPRRCRSRSTS